jgi:hypothetical protein
MLAQLIAPVTGLLDKFIEDKDTKNALAHEIATMASKQAHESAIAQIEVNKVEAAHKSLFVAGWRPALGWVCVLGFAGNFITIPVTNMVLELVESDVRLPLIAMAEMMPVLMGMLGLGAMRSVEKVKGVQREQ